MTVSGPKPFQHDAKNKGLYNLVGVGLFVLVLIALAVIFVLPTTVEQDTQDPIKIIKNVEIKPVKGVSPSAKSRSSGVTPALPKMDKQRKTAERLLEEVLREQSYLESGRVMIWGANKVIVSYPEALKALSKANAAFDSAHYLLATKQFRHVKTLLKTLEESKETRLIIAMKEGQSALKNADAGAAKKAFSIAVSIQSDNHEALSGLARATSLPTVLKLIEQGRRLELEGYLDAAYRAFRAAANTDPAYQLAQREASRTKRLISEMDYTRAVTETIQGIDKGKFEDAAIALSKAREIRPIAPELRDLANQLKQRREDAAIDILTIDAGQAAENENWVKAASQYQKILKINPTTATGMNGLRRSKRMLRLHNQINNYLKEPDRLSSGETLKHARQLILVGKKSMAPGPHLAAKIKRLKHLIVKASKPHPVLLRSDGKTRVTLYRVARFGNFIEKRIELTPGSYIAVGSRPGYRDVRVEFRVIGTEKTPSIVVKCTERI